MTVFVMTFYATEVIQRRRIDNQLEACASWLTDLINGLITPCAFVFTGWVNFALQSLFLILQCFWELNKNYK